MLGLLALEQRVISARVTVHASFNRGFLLVTTAVTYTRTQVVNHLNDLVPWHFPWA